MLCSPNRTRSLEVAQKYADGIFVSTPDLLEFVPGAVLMPQPIDLSVIEMTRDRALKQFKTTISTGQNKQPGIVTVAHAPSNRKIKGTQYLIDAIDALKKEGVPVELFLVEGMSYEEALYISANADIIVDQLLIGSYGQYSVEMMALGKPVICYIRNDLIKHYPPGLPIINTDIDNGTGT